VVIEQVSLRPLQPLLDPRGVTVSVRGHGLQGSPGGPLQVVAVLSHSVLKQLALGATLGHG